MERRSAIFPVVCLLGAVLVARAQEMRLSLPAWIEAGNAAAPKFEATLNGHPASISAQLGPSSDQVILIVMDVTGDPSYVDPARQALVAEISKLPGNAWVALLRAQDGLHVLADPGPDRHPAIDGIQSLPNSGNPGLLETVQAALSLADGLIRNAPVRVSVLYVTDSNIYSYREDYTNPVINQSDPHDLSRRFPEALVEEKISKLIDAAAPLEAPLFIVHLVDRTDRLNRAYENGLQTLAEATGGREDVCRSLAEIPEAISAAFDRISSGWQLRLTVPPKVHGLAQVHLRGSSGGEELRLSWRSHLETKERKQIADSARPKRSRAAP
jgi:hypothetical protein